MYKKEIVTHEFVFMQEEHVRMIEIKRTIRNMLKQTSYNEQSMIDLLTELEQILVGEWSPPMPF